MTPGETLPVIDISDLMGGGAPSPSLVAQIGAACRGAGFFCISGHGVPDALVAQTFDASARFFALPLAEKQELAIATLGHNRGYVGVGIEALDERAAADHKEAFNLIWTDGRTRPPNVWPSSPALTQSGFQAAVQAYFDALLTVGRRLHAAFALDLGLPADFFDDKIDRPQAALRLLHYPAPQSGATDAAPGAGEHTDYGNVTLLATDGVAGLQLRRRGGDWIEVPAIPGAFVCNIGDCLMRWTNDVYVSTPHRVVAPIAERYSIALFLDPNPEAMVSAIASCVPPGEAPRYAPVTAQNYLQQRFAATYAQR